MLAITLPRRNQPSEQVKYLRGTRYNLEKKAEGGPEIKLSQNDQVKGATAESVAKEYGVSEKTIRNDAKFAEAVDKLPAGQITIFNLDPVYFWALRKTFG